MATIKSRKHPVTSRRQSPAMGMLKAATLFTSLALALPAAAADMAPSPDMGSDRATTKNLPGIKVEAATANDYVSSPKFTQSLQDTPQTIQIIGEDLFNQQGATSLTEALRNTPGVGTFYAGENGNTSTGDSVYMRGFDASSSIYIDGVRDLGSISHDLFNVEQIEVTKGPAGTDNGRSAPTGAINMVSKQARLQDATSATVTAGVDGQKRATADWNKALGSGAALRLNAMWQDSDVAGRDHVNNSRWGFAPSLGFGLDTDTRYYLNLLYVKQDNVPDGFVPTIGLPGWTPQDGIEQLSGHPVDPENFYGTRDDHDDVTAKMATFRFEHDFSDAVKLTNIARWGQTKQDYLLSSFMSTNANIQWTDVDDLSTYTLARSNNTFKDQTNKIVTDQLNLRVDFVTGQVEHNLSTGLELTREEQRTYNTTATGARPAANLYNPDWNDTGDLAWARNGSGSFGKTDTASLYAFDTLKFNERFLLTAGVRADRYKTQFDSNAICDNGTGRRAVPCGGLAVGSIVPTQDAETRDTLLNWKLGAVYKVGDTTSLYADYALSQQPPGGANFSLSAAEGSANSVNADPQKAKTIEIGSKWSLMDDALALNVALFQTDVTNEINNQVLDDFGNPTQTGKKQVKGVELSTVGRITENWSISAGYTHQKTKVGNGPLVTSDGSNNLTYTPENAFTSWTTYRFPFGLTIGGGVRYSGRMHRGTDGAVGTPTFTKSYTVSDAVIAYEVNPHVMLRLNAYNLFDKEYVAAINKSGYRYTPGVPRTFLLSADLRF
jgi:catecholate siderophore receptor